MYNTELFAKKVASPARATSSRTNGRTIGGRSPCPKPSALRRRWHRDRTGDIRCRCSRRERTGRRHRCCAQRERAPRTLHPAAGRAVSAPDELWVEVWGTPCRVWSKGEGPVLGFFAGLGGMPRWAPVLDRLAAQRRVVVPSLPGFPGGGRLHGQLDDLGDWVTAFLDLVVGHLGGPRNDDHRGPSALLGSWHRESVSRSLGPAHR